MTGLELYQVFLGMRLHFSQNTYDYVRYGPKKIHEENMGKNYVMANVFSKEFQTKQDLETRLISIFKHRDCWLNEIMRPQAKKEEAMHRKEVEFYLDDFESALGLLKNQTDDIMSLFKVRSQFEVPMIVSNLMKKEISLETFICFDEILGFIKNIDSVIWNKELLRIEKYKAFFKPDRRKVAKIARPYFQDHT